MLHMFQFRVQGDNFYSRKICAPAENLRSSREGRRKMANNLFSRRTIFVQKYIREYETGKKGRNLS